MSLFDAKPSKLNLNKRGMFDKPEEQLDPVKELTNEDGSAKIISQAILAIRANERQYTKDRQDASDSEFWFAVAFQSRAQKEQFLKLMKLIDLGDKYLDGWEVAKRLGLPLDRVKTAYRDPNKKPKGWDSLT